MMDYLEADHPALRASPALHAFAWREVVARGLRAGASTRARVDAVRLARVIGRDSLVSAFPSLGRPGGAASGPGGTVVCDDPLDDARAGQLLPLLDCDADGFRELPLFYIDPLTVRDGAGDPVLHIADAADVLLFSLPPAERTALLATLAEAGLPPEVITPVQVDPARLQP